MKARIGSVVPLCLLFAGLTVSAAPVALAQDQPSNVHGPSKYLFLSNMTVKPDMFSEVVKNESTEVEALRNGNAPAHYIGMGSITGTNHAIFFSGFDSFAQMQKEHEAMMSNSTLAETLRSSDAAEAPSIAEQAGSIYQYREDLSLNAPVDIAQMRFFEIRLFRIHSGHHQDWEQLVKLYMKAYANNPNARWATFEKRYGVGSGNTFIVVTPMKSLSEVDDELADDAKLPSSMGQDQMQTMHQLSTAAIESSEEDLFAVIPRMSYVPAAWVTASPDFWGKK